MDNLIDFPNDPNGVGWGSFDFGAATANFAAAYDGTTTAFKLQDSSGTGVYSVYWAETIAASALPYCGWVWFPKAGVAPTHYPIIDIRFGSYTIPSKYGGVVMNPVTGVATPRAGWVPDGPYGSIDMGTWWLFYCTVYNAGYTTVNVGIAPVFNNDGTGNIDAGDIGMMGNHNFWTAGLGQGLIPDSPVENVVANDWRLVGGRYMAGNDDEVWALSSPFTHRITFASRDVANHLWPDTGELTAAPGAVAWSASAAWSVWEDGFVRRHTAAGVQSEEIYTESSTAAWIQYHTTGFILAPGRKGQIVSIDTVSNEILSELDQVLPRVVSAVLVGDYLYCFGDSATAAIVTIDGDGYLQKIAEFRATNCGGAVRVKKVLDEDQIVVATPTHLTILDITDKEAPVIDSTTKSSREIVGVTDLGTEILQSSDLDQPLDVYPGMDAAWSATSQRFSILHPAGRVTLVKM